MRQEVISKKFAEILGRLTFGENVLAWVTQGLRESHALEQQEHDAAIKRLQGEYDRLQNRLHALYVDKLDGTIDRSFYAQMSEQWQVEQDKITQDILRHQAADRSYLEEGARIIEIGHGAQRLFVKQPVSEQRRLLNFVLSNSTWQNGELTPVFRQPFDLIAETTAAITASGGQEGLNSPGHSVWLGDLDSNQD